MVSKVEQMLARLHGVTVETMGHPLAAIYMDWGQEYESGWHTWEAQSEPWKDVDKLLEPAKGLYFCGEAFSREQGWIEGALKSTERTIAKLLSNHFNELGQVLPPTKPTWIFSMRDADFRDYINS